MARMAMALGAIAGLLLGLGLLAPAGLAATGLITPDSATAASLPWPAGEVLSALENGNSRPYLGVVAAAMDITRPVLETGSKRGSNAQPGRHDAAASLPETGQDRAAVAETRLPLAPPANAPRWSEPGSIQDRIQRGYQAVYLIQRVVVHKADANNAVLRIEPKLFAKPN